MGRAIMESAVLGEVLKTLTHRGTDPEMYFWRTSAGVEVDLLVRVGGKLIPLEVKLSATPRPAMASSIRAFQEDLGQMAGAGFLVHPGEGRLPMGARVTAIGLSEL